jgi:hypothetical protein
MFANEIKEPPTEFGFCPNCNGSWEWRTAECLPLGAHGDMLICTECISKPDKLNVRRIATSLIKLGWAVSDVQIAGVAISDFISGKLMTTP